MGSEFFNQVQYGKEVTKGTLVAATQLFVGQMPAIKSDRKPKYPKEHWGVRADSFRGLIGQYLYQNTLSVDDGAFQHLPLLLSGIKGGVAAAEQTASQLDYLWTHTPSYTASNAPDAFSLRFGDDQQAYISEYCMFERIKIGGQVTQGGDFSPVRLEADFFGRQIATTTFTGSLSPRTLEPINAKLAQLYIDTSWAGVGGTELANVLRTFDVEILTGVKPKFSGSTAKYFNRHSEGIISCMATFGIEGGSEAVTAFTAQLAGTLQVARLKILGSQIGTGVNYNLTIDMSGTLEDATPISGNDRGDNLGQLTLHGFYDKTASKSLQISCVTNHNTV